MKPASFLPELFIFRLIVLLSLLIDLTSACILVVACIKVPTWLAEHDNLIFLAWSGAILQGSFWMLALIITLSALFGLEWAMSLLVLSMGLIYAAALSFFFVFETKLLGWDLLPNLAMKCWLIFRAMFGWWLVILSLVKSKSGSRETGRR